MFRDRRSWLLIGLLALYAVPALGPVLASKVRRGAFDPFLPAARALEQRLADGRYGEALSLAIDLDRAFPREPQVAMWIARAHHGLNDPSSEAAAWERYIAASPAPEEACPALPEAYAAADQPAESLRAYERCAQFDATDAPRLIDLGDAYIRANRRREALEQYERAAQVDPDDPDLAGRLASIRDMRIDTR